MVEGCTDHGVVSRLQHKATAYKTADLAFTVGYQLAYAMLEVFAEHQQTQIQLTAGCTLLTSGGKKNNKQVKISNKYT